MRVVRVPSPTVHQKGSGMQVDGKIGGVMMNDSTA